MSVTLTQLRNVFYDILREEQDSSAYPYTLVDLMLNSSQLRICNGRVINPLTKEEARKGQLSFLNTSKYYSNVKPTGLTAATTEGATTLTVTSTTNFPSTGTLYIKGNIITYTGLTATTFTGVTGVLFAFAIGSEVSISYALPTNYSSAIGVTYNNKFKLPAKQYDDIFEDLNSLKGSNYGRNRANGIYESQYNIKPFYVIIDDTYLVPFQLSDTGVPILLRYEKVPTTLSATTDTATISNDIYAKTTIPYIAVGEMLYNRGEEGRAGEILNFGIGQVREMYDHYNKASYEKISGTQYKMAKGRLNI